MPFCDECGRGCTPGDEANGTTAGVPGARAEVATGAQHAVHVGPDRARRPGAPVPQHAHEPWVGAWEVPGGFLDHGEHPEAGARREVREELGIDVELTGLLGIYVHPVPGGEPLLIVVYVGTTAADDARRHPTRSRGGRRLALVRSHGRPRRDGRGPPSPHRRLAGRTSCLAPRRRLGDNPLSDSPNARLACPDVRAWAQNRRRICADDGGTMRERWDGLHARRRTGSGRRRARWREQLAERERLGASARWPAGARSGRRPRGGSARCRRAPTTGPRTSAHRLEPPRRRRRYSTWSVRYTKARSASTDSHTDRLISRRSSSNTRIDVASPSSSCRRHTKPGDGVGEGVDGSSAATNPWAGGRRRSGRRCDRCSPGRGGGTGSRRHPRTDRRRRWRRWVVQWMRPLGGRRRCGRGRRSSSGRPPVCGTGATHRGRGGGCGPQGARAVAEPERGLERAGLAVDARGESLPERISTSASVQRSQPPERVDAAGRPRRRSLATSAAPSMQRQRCRARRCRCGPGRRAAEVIELVGVVGHEDHGGAVDRSARWARRAGGRTGASRPIRSGSMSVTVWTLASR